MHEMLYSLPSAVIALMLFVAMTATIEVSFRIGIRRRRTEKDAFTEHINAVQAALLGILALILGFTFSLALQRYDSRSEAVVDEANAIGTTWLRSQLLTPVVRGDVQKLMRDYVDSRVEESRLTMVKGAERDALNATAARLQLALWERTVRAIEIDPSQVRSGLFAESLNGMIDSYGRREASLLRHVPEVVLYLLFATFIMVCTSIGYAAGVAGYRASLVTYVMVSLIVLLVFLIVDVDRPRRGFVTISHKNLTDLQVTMSTGLPAAPPVR